MCFLLRWILYFLINHSGISLFSWWYCQWLTNPWHWHCLYHFMYQQNQTHLPTYSSFPVCPWFTLQPHFATMAHSKLSKTKWKLIISDLSSWLPLYCHNQIVPLLYHPNSNLSVFQLVLPQKVLTADDLTPSTITPTSLELLHGFKAIISSPSLETPFHLHPHEYSNMSSNQQLLYDWHVHFGHMNFATIQSMAHKNIGIPHKLACCHPPLCHECQYGKAKWCSLHNPQPIGECLLHPGEMCCIDQMIAGCPGLPYTIHGQRSHWW